MPLEARWLRWYPASDQVPTFRPTQPHTPRILTVSMDPEIVAQFTKHLKATPASCGLAIAVAAVRSQPKARPAQPEKP